MDDQKGRAGLGAFDFFNKHVSDNTNYRTTAISVCACVCVCVCVCFNSIEHSHAIRPYFPSHSILLALVLPMGDQ